jgi:transketolase
MTPIALADSVERCRHLAARIRLDVIQMSHRAQTAHLGGALSCVDLLSALYLDFLDISPSRVTDPLRDRLVFSKGHAVSALYALLAETGYFPREDLLHYNEAGFHLPEQPSPHCAPGIEWATGSLGHGLGVGIGMALAARVQGASFKVVVLMSDGECQEGSVWEGAMLAPKLGLDNLTILVDFNKWQATARSADTMAMEPFGEKWRSFGWDACEIDGHDIEAILKVLRTPVTHGKPRAIVAHTVKGKGASYAEDDNNWHYRSPTDAEVKQAAKELGLA